MVDVTMVAYIAPQVESSAHGDTHRPRQRFSGYVSNNRDEIIESSPEFQTLDDAITWARERSDIVWARDLDSDYFWAGAGDPPPGAVVSGHLPMVARGETSLGNSVERTIKAEATLFADMRGDRGISIKELSKLSGVPSRVIRRIESGRPPYVADFGIWVDLAFALTGRERKNSTVTIGWVAVQGSMLASAIAFVNESGSH